MNHHTIVIGPDENIASKVMLYWARKETPPLYAPRPDMNVVRDHLAGYEFFGFMHAPYRLEGARPRRIVIAAYLQWRSATPGRCAEAWDCVQRLKALDPSMKVTFLP